MRPQRVLFIGGSGIISSACSRAGGRARPRPDRAQPRRQHATGRCPTGSTVLRADIRDAGVGARGARRPRRSTPSSTGVAFTPDHVRADLDLFAGRTGQYVFISSASAYQTPPARLPVDGVDAAAQPVLAVLPRQDRLRGPARRAPTASDGLPGDDRAAVAHLRPHRDPARRRLDRHRTGCARASRSSCTATAPRCGR